MSTTIDNRVVQMTFDNENFERNAQKSLTTLNNLDQALKFDKSAESLDRLASAANKTSFSGLEKGVIKVQSQFSALQVISFTALQNITNTAINAGKRIVNALTIDPVKTGFQEYETQIDAIQTILSNTRSKGTTIDDVNRALDELNAYADKTIYNFTQMTKNIGTFTAAGIDVNTATNSIKGIANLAAVSGSNAQQASTAMYQLSQALAAGRISLQDWNSVVNAGMGGEVFQEALKRTARVMGTGVDEAIEKYGTFRESLSKGQWLTKEVLTETLNQLANAYTKEELLAKGYTEKQAQEILDLGDDAEKAATMVKTLTQLWGTLTEAVQSGWTTSWEILVGDFYQARDLLTSISDAIGSIIQAQSDMRNKFLTEAFGKMSITPEWYESMNKYAKVFSKKDLTSLNTVAEKYNLNLKKMIKESGSFKETLKSGWLDKEAFGTLVKYTNGLKEVVKSTKDGEKNQEKLTKAMHKTLKTEYPDAISMAEDLKKKNISASAAYASLNSRLEKSGMTLRNFTDEGLREAKYSEQKIKNIHLFVEAIRYMDDQYLTVMKQLTMDTGRDMIIESFKNIFNYLGKVLKAIGKAFTTVFDNINGYGIYDAIERFRDFTRTLNLTDEQAEKITRTFIPLFRIIKSGIDTLKLLGSATATISKYLANIVKVALNFAGQFAKFIFNLGKGTKQTTAFSDILSAIADKIKDFVDGLKSAGDAAGDFAGKIASLNGVKRLYDDLAQVANIIKSFAVDNLTKIVDKIKELISSIEPLKNFTLDAPLKQIDEWANKLSNFIEGKLNKDSDTETGIDGMANRVDSDSTELGGATDHFVEAKNNLVDALQSFGDMAREAVANINFDRIMDMLRISTLVLIAFKVAQLIGKLRDIANGGEGVVLKLKRLIDNLNKSIVTNQMKERANAIYRMAEALGIIAAAMLALSFVPEDKLAAVTVDLGILLVIMGIIVKIGTGMKKSAEDVDAGAKSIVDSLMGFLNGIKAALLKSVKMVAFGAFAVMLAAAIAILAHTLLQFIKIPWSEIETGLTALSGVIALLILLSFSINTFAQDLNLKQAAAILAMGYAIKQLSEVVVIFSTLDPMKLAQALASVVGLMAMIGVLAVASGAAKMGSMAAGVILLAVGLQLLVPALLEFALIPWTTFAYGAALMGSLIAGLAFISSIAQGSVAGAAAILIMVTALDLLVPALVFLGMAIVPAAAGLALLGTAIVVLTGSALIVTTLSGAFAVLMGVLLGIGKTVLMIGAGFFLFGNGLVAAALGVQMLGHALPVLAEGIVSAAEILAQGADKIASAVASCISAVVQVVKEVGGQIGIAVVHIIIGIVQAVITYAPVILNAIKSGLVAFWNWLTTDLDVKLANLIIAISKAFMNLSIALRKLNEEIWKGIIVLFKAALNAVIEFAAQKLESLPLVGKKLSDLIRGLKFDLTKIVNKEDGKKAEEEYGEGFKEGTKETMDEVNAETSLGFGEISDTLSGNIPTTGIDKYSDDVNKKLEELEKSTGIKMDKISGNVSEIGSGQKIDTSSAQKSIKQITKSYNNLTKSSGKSGTDAGNSLVKHLASAISKATGIKNAGEKAAKKGADGAKSQRSKFETSGKNLIAGLINGIHSRFGALYAAGAAAGRQFHAGYKSTAKEGSPSRLMMQSGIYLMEGLIIGVRSMYNKVTTAGSDAANAAISKVSYVKDRLLSILDDGLNSSPVITPVLDMDNFTQGMDTINGSFGARTLSLSANSINAVGSINGSAFGRNGNQDVINAIDRLGRSVDNMPRNTYTVNGITYDDGSNIHSAIDTLIRATVVEGRA